MIGHEINQSLTRSLNFLHDLPFKILIGDLYIHLTSEIFGFGPNDVYGFLVLLSDFMNIGDSSHIFFQIEDFDVYLIQLGFNFLQTPLKLRVL